MFSITRPGVSWLRAFFFRIFVILPNLFDIFLHNSNLIPIFTMSKENNNTLKQRAMTQKEFTDRTRLTPDNDEFNFIHAVYMETSMDKDEFCNDFKKHGNSKIIRDLHATAVNFELKCEYQKKSINDMVDVLLGKAEAYQDTDFYRMAVKMTSEKHVVMRKMEMNLPLWDEDKEFIKSNLK